MRIWCSRAVSAAEFVGGSGVLWLALPGLSDMIPQNHCINDPPEKYRKVNPTEIVLKYFNLSFWGLRKNATVLVSVVHPAIEYAWWSLYICPFFEDPNVGSIQGCRAYRVTAQKSPCRARSWEANAQDLDNVQKSAAALGLSADVKEEFWGSPWSLPNITHCDVVEVMLWTSNMRHDSSCVIQAVVAGRFFNFWWWYHHH